MPFILGANSLTGGYTVDNSLRFNSVSSDYLSKTYGTPTSTQKWTASFWIKRSELSREQHIFGGTSPSQCYFVSNDTLRFADTTAGTNYYTTQVFRDTSAWYHFVIAVDTTLGTAGDRARIYVNGSEITSFSTETNATQNNNSAYNVASTLYAIGRYNPSPSGNYFGGYMSEMNFIDGQQLTPTDFGEFDEDSGIWKPIAYAGTYGTNGFYLETKDSGALGADTSGNGNNFTVNNLTAVDQSTDTPTNNFATWNVNLATNSTMTMADGNLTGTSGSNYASGASNSWFSTQGASQGKWYAEFLLTYQSDTDAGIVGVGYDLSKHQQGTALSAHSLYNIPEGWGYVGQGNIKNNNADLFVASSYAVNDIIGVAMDLDNNKLYFAKNGTWQNSGVPTSGATGTGAFSLTSGQDYFFGMSDASLANTFTYKANFGSPAYTISSGNADANGYGNFEYSVPTGYYSLNTANLAEFG